MPLQMPQIAIVIIAIYYLSNGVLTIYELKYIHLLSGIPFEMFNMLLNDHQKPREWEAIIGIEWVHLNHHQRSTDFRLSRINDAFISKMN